MTVLISIPVHERSEVVLDQLKNIRRFCPNSHVILHINPTFEERQPVIEFAKHNSFVTINKYHATTDWANLIQTHLLNFRYAEEIGLSFSHFAMHASNDMFVKLGVEEYILNHVAGFHIIPTYDDMQWTPWRRAQHDTQLKQILQDIDQKDIIASQIEGTFYERSFFRQITDIIERRFRQQEIAKYMTKNDADTNNTFYAREEIYFSTIASKLTENPVFPYVYNEAWTGVRISIPVIQEVISDSVSKKNCMERRFVTPNIRLYDPQHLFCVKRVARVYDDPVREFIRSLP